VKHFDDTQPARVGMADRPTLLMTEAHRPNVTPPPNERRRVLAWHLFVSSPDPTVEWGDDMHAEGLDTFEAWAELPRPATAADLLAALGLKPSDIGFACDDARFRAERRNDRSSASAARMVRLRAVLARLEKEARDE
jgi:hypothetical protein